MSTILPAEQFENGNIINRLGSSPTLKNLLLDGITSRWNETYLGNEFDFLPGMAINFTVQVEEITAEKENERYLEVLIKDGVCGRSNQSTTGWSTSSARIITIYSSLCDDADHKNKSVVDCTTYQDNLKTMTDYEGTVAHEFGHTFGLADMYYDAYVNNGYEPLANPEIIYNTMLFSLPKGEGIMMINGSGTTNDLEMIMLAFSENAKQFFVPHGSTQKISKAIRHEVEYTFNGYLLPVYVWNPQTTSFEVRADKEG
jgi:hypothetical protein